MKKVFLIVTVLFFSFLSGKGMAQNYLFYLHGQILEIQGIHAVDTVHGYGAYEYTQIINQFKEHHFKVISEVRKRNTNPVQYAHKTVGEIDSLLRAGVPANHITVVGASKGSLIAMLTSSFLKNKHVNFVFMSACNRFSEQHFPDLRFYGNILSIFEASDVIGHTCQPFEIKSENTTPHYKEIELHTGLRHGYLYKPLKEWMDPAFKWANRQYDKVH